MSEPCQCGMPEKWAADSTFPVGFNAKMNEYHIVHGPSQNATAIMRFCFWCGGKLPASKRDSFFTEPSEEELQRVRSVMEQVHDANSMRAVLGEPDFVHPRRTDDYSADQARIYNMKFPRTQYLYQTGWKTLSLFVNEQDDGSLSYSISGKQKKGTD